MMKWRVKKVINISIFYILFRMTNQSNYPVYFAGLILTAIPSVILYAVFQDKIMTSMNIGGLKG